MWGSKSKHYIKAQDLIKHLYWCWKCTQASHFNLWRHIPALVCLCFCLLRNICVICWFLGSLEPARSGTCGSGTRPHFYSSWASYKSGRRWCWLRARGKKFACAGTCFWMQLCITPKWTCNVNLVSNVKLVRCSDKKTCKFVQYSVNFI